MNALQTAQNDLDMPTGQRERHAYLALAAQYASLGYELIRGDPEVRGQAPYAVVYFPNCKPLHCIYEVQEHLARLKRTRRGQELQAQ